MTVEDAIESLDAYADHGRPTGDFLRAVLENNLMEAFGRADTTSRYNLFDICRYVYSELRGDCWGSPERVRHWLEKKRAEAEV